MATYVVDMAFLSETSALMVKNLATTRLVAEENKMRELQS